MQNYWDRKKRRRGAEKRSNDKTESRLRRRRCIAIAGGVFRCGAKHWKKACNFSVVETNGTVV